MVAIHLRRCLPLALISFLTASAHPAIPAEIANEDAPAIESGADRSVNAAWSLTIYSKPYDPSDAIAFEAAGSSTTDCKNFGGSSFSFDNLCDPMAQVGFQLQIFRDGDCGGPKQAFSGTREAINERFESWRVVGTNEC